MPRDDLDRPDLRTDNLDGAEPTARPSARAPRRPDDQDQDRLVPSTNVGGATPTPLGLDSGGDLPGPDDDLTSLAQPEPPAAPEVDGLSVRSEDDIVPTMGTSEPES